MSKARNKPGNKDIKFKIVNKHETSKDVLHQFASDVENKAIWFYENENKDQVNITINRRRQEICI